MAVVAQFITAGSNPAGHTLAGIFRSLVQAAHSAIDGTAHRAARLHIGFLALRSSSLGTTATPVAGLEVLTSAAESLARTTRAAFVANGARWT